MIIDGKAAAEEVLEQVRVRVQKLKSTPCLAAVIVGDDKPSHIYVKNKIKMCRSTGIKSVECELPGSASQKEIIDSVKKLNEDKEITAILVQLPLPNHVNKYSVIESIAPSKDVDAFTSANFSNTVFGISDFIPCTPAGIIYLIKKMGVRIEGSHCVIVGRSEIVGKPLAFALLNLNATVTICHSKTHDLKKHCTSADILICAVGKPGIIKGDMIKTGAVVIDVGISRSEGRIRGDVCFEEAANIASYITPVPGGVGPMTVAFLMKNTVDIFEKYHILNIE
ncbi:MAG: bifunctional 5,10-methylenetetrahydrofolate dehydrogenase/5,10-methenyltetrahydrofolate cyclohydrolase [Oscillospiraceae bacterium]|jgi:methylenetetrahydrofolate dehydrogenase (NADP+)/methenyltetrahydrofolate cyclohydrolase|nr:bifunctional 5,10-methylenetetrahydrofolate dehydrogenase/5,10-methenyltetrahydrofolate cyclohydrolase [Oscillospiraceae bacterium]